MHLVLGNVKAKEGVGDGIVTEYRPLPGKRETEVHFPDDWTLGQALVALTAPTGIWASHSDAPPAWCRSDSDGLAALVAEHYGCSIRKDGD